jgi:hypothetical protein
MKILYKNLVLVDFRKGDNKSRCYIVPNVSLIAREMTGTSQISIILHKFLKLSFKTKIKLAWNNLPYLINLLMMDYATGVKVLCELEMLYVGVSGDNVVCLHSQMLDMAVAVNNKKVIQYFFYLSKKYKFIPALKTNNYSYLLKCLSNMDRVPNNLIIFS